MSRAKRAALPAAVLVLGAGCSRPPALPPAPAGTAQWALALTAAPTPPRQLDPVQMTVRVTDARHKPVSGASVSAALTMPGMDMGRNEVALRESATPGIYIGTGRFTMPGDWSALVTARKGAARAAQAFPVTVR